MSAARTFSSTPFASPGVTPQSLGVPAAAYPGRIATNSDLIVAVDRQQTRLALPLNASDTSMTVADPAIIVAYSLLSIDNELVKTTGAPVGNVVPVSRGFDGTTPAVHLAGATVSGMVDAFHHNGLVAEIEAIEATLGANLANLPTSPFIINGPFNFAPQSPGGSLIVGANSISLSPVPPGVSGTDVGHYVYISGGTGTAEAALILGGTAVGGSPSGTLIIQCANAHSGAWTIRSATGGIQEAICSLPAAGGLVLVNSNVTLTANVGPAGKAWVTVTKLTGFTISGAFTIFSQTNWGTAQSESFTYPANQTVRPSVADWSGNQPSRGFEVNVNNVPTSLYPAQMQASAITGSIVAPPSSTAGQITGVSGLASSQSATPAAVGLFAYANAPVTNGLAWGANVAVSNQLNPTSTVGAVTRSLIGLEIDCNNFDNGSGAGSASLTGLQIIGGHSNVQPPIAVGIEIAPLGGTTAVKWQQGIKFDTAATQTAAIDILPANNGSNSGGQLIRIWAVDSGGQSRQAYITAQPSGLLQLSGGTGTPNAGVLLQDGGANPLLWVQPGGFAYLAALPVYPDNATAFASGLSAGRLYRTAIGAVMQVF